MEFQNNLSHEDENVELELDDELISTVPFQLGGHFSPETNEFLQSPTSARQDADIPKVLADLEELEFFQKFTNVTKDKLCKKMVLMSFNHDHYLLRQGEDVSAFFILRSGVVSIRYNILTPNTNSGAETQWPERILKRGEYFGHSDLLRHRESTIDAYTIGHVECLVLEIEDFNLIKNKLKAEQVNLKRTILATDLVKKFRWSEEELNALEMFSKLKNHLDQVEIYNGPSGARPKWSYFLTKGDCKLARDVKFSILDNGYQAISEESKNYSKVFTKTLEFETVSKNFFFGVGEYFGCNRVFAKPGSEFLMIFRLILVFKNNDLLKNMAECLTKSLPSDQALLNKFVELEKSETEVEGLIAGVLQGNPERMRYGVENAKPAFMKYF